MKRKDAKYLLAFLLPITAYIGLEWRGYFAPGAVYLAFLLIPILDQLFPRDPHNKTAGEISKQAHVLFFDLLLWINVPIVFFILAKYLYILEHVSLSAFEQYSLMLNVALVFSSCGINVAHELGHRTGSYNQWMSKLLLLPSMYCHFTISHNYGHHKWIGSEKDSVTARKNEVLFLFWLRAIKGVYKEAWNIENRRLMRSGKSKWHWTNQMITNTILQLAYLGLILYLCSFQTFLLLLLSGFVSVLLLETIDYVEHYGIQRKTLPSGQLERVNGSHSWNSNHVLGRIFLFELVRHADHHLHANKKYQSLQHIDESPELPYGYPMSILIALVPPLWFKIMNPRIEKA